MERLKYNQIIKYKVEAQCNSTLHIGSATGGKEEVLTHPVDGKPFIQATSICGAFRSHFLKKYGAYKTDSLFGGNDSDDNEFSSKAKITDGIFKTDTLKMEIRPHVKIDEKTGTVANASKLSSGQKFDMEYISAGTQFNFEIYLYIDKEKDDNIVLEFETLFSDMNDENIVIGAKKSTGSGKSRLISLKKKMFDMTKQEDRELWEEEDVLENNQYEDYLSNIKKSNNTGLAYRIYLEGETEGALQIRGLAMDVFGEDAPDSENIKNANGEYIIPGSSIRGVLHAQMKKIEKYINKSGLVDKAFGYGGERAAEGKKGNLICNDTVIDCEKQMDVIRNRIHIDKFTGGVIHGHKFREKNVAGKVRFQFEIQDDGNADKTAALLLFALRDMAMGIINVGNGYATGKGFISNSRIIIESMGKVEMISKADIIYKDNENIEVSDNENVLAKVMNSLKEVG